ncbi:MAG: dihydropteroate synthase [Bacteroidales bacterium]|nr:dihydropteroate synthase [Bacteroidales bacterium]
MNIIAQKKSINCKGQIIDFSVPKIMGIVNITPDSFFQNSRCNSEKEIISRVSQMISDGANFIDIGAYSTRPGCDFVSEDDEICRIKFALNIISKEFPNALISIDTYRSKVAKISVEEYGASLINDISAGQLDNEMFNTIANLKIPYIAMHMQGNPQNMNKFINYNNFIKDIIEYFSDKINHLKNLGVNDIIIDPGFGFSKTIDQNYELLNNLSEFKILECPILVGISRKSMIYKFLETSPENSLNGTSILNTISVIKGADILRVHDVKQAYEVVKLCKKTGLLL